VILADLMPTVPFVILIMIPFVEQIEPQVEAAARVFAAGVRLGQSIDAMAVVYMVTTLVWLLNCCGC
jgi:hypothetical protein